MKILYKMFIAGALLTLVACDNDFDDNVTDKGFYSSGEADFTKFVAVGNSLTAGYADNALYISGQNNSFPNILATRFAYAGGGEFKQPMMADNKGGLLLNGAQITDNRMVLSFIEGNASPTILAGAPTTDVIPALKGEFNNMGVAGAKSFHLNLPGYGNPAGIETGQANPYFARFASSTAATVLDDALAMNATFYSLWIGNNDILAYATSGGVGKDQTGNTNLATYGPDDITDPGVFHQVYKNLLDKLSADGKVQGVVANIPDVTTIPFFNTVPLKAIPLDKPTADLVNSNFKAYNDVLPMLAQMGALPADEAASRVVKFAAGQNAPIIKDKDLTDLTDALKSVGVDAATAAMLGQLRQAGDGDLLLLPSSSVLGQLADPSNPMSIMGVAVPLGDGLVLTKKEQAKVHTAMLSYNASIKSLADASNAAFVDANKILTELDAGGIPFDGGIVTSAYVTGGAFSLDGVHPTPRGYAYLANKMVEAIQDKYKAKLPIVNIGEYPTVTPHQN